MDRLRQDFLVAIRRLRSSPGFTIAAIVTLALGIGANTTVFSAVNALVFRSLAVDRPDELVSVNTRMGTRGSIQSYPNYIDFRDRNTVLSGLAIYRPQPVNFSLGAGNNVRMWGYEVSGNYFDVLGVRAARGRMLTAEDDRVRGGHPVAVISWACWQQRFAGDPNIAGKTVKLNGMNYNVLGVAPREFIGTEMIYTPEIYVPMAMAPRSKAMETGWINGAINLFAVGRLKPGVGVRRRKRVWIPSPIDWAANIPRRTKECTSNYRHPDYSAISAGTIRGFAAVLMGVAGLVC